MDRYVLASFKSILLCLLVMQFCSFGQFFIFDGINNGVWFVLFHLLLYILFVCTQLVVCFVLLDTAKQLIALMDRYSLKIIKRTLLVLFVLFFVVRCVLVSFIIRRQKKASVLNFTSVTGTVIFIIICGTQLAIGFILLSMGILLCQYCSVNTRIGHNTFTTIKRITFDLLVFHTYLDILFNSKDNPQLSSAFFFLVSVIFVSLYVIQKYVATKVHFTLVAVIMVLKVLSTGIYILLKILMIVQSSTKVGQYQMFTWLLELIEAGVVVTFAVKFRSNLSTATGPTDSQPWLGTNRPTNAIHAV